MGNLSLRLNVLEAIRLLPLEEQSGITTQDYLEFDG